MNELKIHTEKEISDIHRSTNEYKKEAYQPRTSLEEDEIGDLIADSLF
jgi:hypothetical protein